MSVTDDVADCTDGGCAEYPQPDLEWFIDDPVDPGEMTLTPTDPADPTTEWLSVDPAAAIPLEDAL
jgi:hypothetical protein